MRNESSVQNLADVSEIQESLCVAQNTERLQGTGSYMRTCWSLAVAVMEVRNKKYEGKKILFAKT
jgi:hypothetical protein